MKLKRITPAVIEELDDMVSNGAVMYMLPWMLKEKRKRVVQKINQILKEELT